MIPAPAPDPQQPARPVIDLLTASARLLARRQLHDTPSLHTTGRILQIVTAEYRILEVLNHELATHTPAAWIEVFKQRQSEEAQDYVREAKSTEYEEEEERTFVPSAVSVPLKPLFRCDNQCSEKTQLLAAGVGGAE